MMTKNKLIAEANLKRLGNYLKNPNISLTIYGDKYLYKNKIIESLATEILGISESEIKDYPYLLKIKPNNHKIGIEQIKDINRFIKLKVPVIKKINRIILIYTADKMTIEAQNAFLKNLEEPPSGTLFLMSTNNLTSLLSTIRSRTINIRILKPTTKEILLHFKKQGYSQDEIKKAINISNSLPKLVANTLSKKDHNLDNKIRLAKQIISSSYFDKLKLIDDIVQDKDRLKDILYIIKQMSQFGILSKSHEEANRWLNILDKTIAIEDDIKKKGQLKLLLTNYFLNV